MLDFLVFSYRIFEGEKPEIFIKHAEFFQRHFTSYLFEILDPHAFLKEIKKHTSKVFSKDLSFEDYISKDPESINVYI